MFSYSAAWRVVHRFDALKLAASFIASSLVVYAYNTLAYNTLVYPVAALDWLRERVAAEVYRALFNPVTITCEVVMLTGLAYLAVTAVEEGGGEKNTSA